MVFDVSEQDVKAAKAAHELFMVNLGALLLLGPLSIFVGIGRLAIIVPLLVSLFFALFTWYRCRVHAADSTWFVAVHWRLALHNYRWLFIGFALTLLLLVVSWGLEVTLDPHSPSHFLPFALTRIGVMPALVMLFASFVIGNGALNQVLRHEVPQKLVSAYPPPEHLRLGAANDQSSSS